MLGLTIHEIPIDSRVAGWLKANGLPVKYPLTNERDYCRVLDDIQELCRRAKIVPCLFDAAVFAAKG